MDYFTGLIQRTGIVIGADAEPERLVGDRAPWDAQEPDAVAQCETEVEKLMSPPAAAANCSDEAAEGKFGDSCLGELPAGDSQASAAAVTTRLSEAETSSAARETSPLPEIENTTFESAPSDGKKPKQAEKDARLSKERQAKKGNAASTEGKRSEPKSDRVTAEKPSVGESVAERETEPGGTGQLMEPEFSMPRPASMAVTRMPGKLASSGRQCIQGGGVRQEQVLRSVHQQIREWVSREPAFTTEEQRSQAAAQIVRQVEPVLRERSREGPDAFLTGRAAAEAKPGGEGLIEYNVQVAVGPVSITIEQPEPRAQGAKPPVPGDSRPASSERSSRLSRRYLHS